MRTLCAILLCSCALGCGDDNGAAGSGGSASVETGGTGGGGTGATTKDAGATGGVGGGDSGMDGGGVMPGGPPMTCDGDYVIEDLTGAAGMADNVSVSDIVNCTTITGYLSIRDAEEVNLPRLEKVVGFIEVVSATLKTLSLPALTTVEGHVPVEHYSVASIEIHAGALASLDLSSLETLGNATDTGSFDLVGNRKLDALDLPALTSVGRVTVETCGVLTHVSLPLVASSSLLVRNNLMLTMLSAPKLKGATYLSVIHNSSLKSLALPALATADNALDIFFNDALETVNLPALASVGLEAEAPASSEVVAGLRVASNASLTSVTAPGLTKVANGFEISGNTKLPTCQAQAILDQVTLTDATPKIEGNMGTCP